MSHLVYIPHREKEKRQKDESRHPNETSRPANELSGGFISPQKKDKKTKRQKNDISGPPNEPIHHLFPPPTLKKGQKD